MTVALDDAIPVWPRKLAPRAPGQGMIRPVMVGPSPLSGAPQTVMSGMGGWRIVYEGIRLHDGQDRLRLFRALFYGRLGLGLPIYVPLYDWRRSARARGGLSALPTLTPFSDASTFSDTSRFSSDIPGHQVAVAAAGQAMSLSVTVVDGAGPVPEAGEFFGLGERAHMVTAAFPDDAVVGRTTLQFWPPLRDGASIGDSIETGDPVCRVVLDPAQVEMITRLDLSIVGEVDLTFVEDW